MRKYDPKNKNYEFHILVELMRGGDMESYLSRYGPANAIDRVKSIGG